MGGISGKGRRNPGFASLYAIVDICQLMPCAWFRSRALGNLLQAKLIEAKTFAGGRRCYVTTQYRPRDSGAQAARPPEAGTKLMLSTVTPTQVRQLVTAYLGRRQIEAPDSAIIETLLIRDGRYFGRSYRVAGVMAMWMIDIGLLQFYGADGDMLGSLSLLEPAAPETRKAA